MILHTIVPMELLVEPMEKSSESFPISGGVVSALKNASGEYVVDSLFSTDPFLYLSGQYAPGSPFDPKAGRTPPRR